MRRLLAPALGALVAGTLGVTVSLGIVGTSERLFRDLFVTDMAFAAAVALLVAKLVATAATVGSGGSGGLVFPAFVIGALTGSAVAAAFGTGAATPMHSAFLVCGTTALLATALNVPVAASVMMIEMCGPSFIAPVIVGASLGFWIGRPKVVYSYASQGDRAELEADRRAPGT